jgi:hypothetical protein
MCQLIRQIWVRIIFVTILYMVSYTNRNSNAILQVHHLREFFLNKHHPAQKFSKVCFCFFILKEESNKLIDHIG